MGEVHHILPGCKVLIDSLSLLIGGLQLQKDLQSIILQPTTFWWCGMLS
jgi:hypothetical protein